jgi:hypothetical protein
MHEPVCKSAIYEKLEKGRERITYIIARDLLVEEIRQVITPAKDDRFTPLLSESMEWKNKSDQARHEWHGRAQECRICQCISRVRLRGPLSTRFEMLYGAVQISLSVLVNITTTVMRQFWENPAIWEGK